MWHSLFILSVQYILKRHPCGLFCLMILSNDLDCACIDLSCLALPNRHHNDVASSIETVDFMFFTKSSNKKHCNMFFTIDDILSTKRL